MTKTTIFRFYGQVLFFVCQLLFTSQLLNAAIKTTVNSGDWNAAGTWSPAGVPNQNDDVIIASPNKINITAASFAKTITVNPTAELNITQGLLTLNGALLINGKVDLNGGNILQQTNNAPFIINNTGTFIWNPSDNTANGASLFLKSIESFSPASTLIIKKWYACSSVPLGSVVSGDFGNVTISTIVGGTLFEWNQDNQFEYHQIKGILTIENGWVVLDKSGHITQTKIGSIILSNVNSVLDFHSGTHPGSFTIETDSIANIGGEINGILNGNGNIRLVVTGGFFNMGNVELIYNAGIANVGNGNAELLIGKNYKQTHGDLRGIFNLSTTQSGKVDMQFGSIDFIGGILIAYYGCNSIGTVNTFKVLNDFSINLSNGTDKFRVNGLTSLMGQYSKARADFKVFGNLTLTGNTGAEFTTSGSVGSEELFVKGTFEINGLNSNLNYGSHAVNLTVDGDFIVKGGYAYLSRMPGNAQYQFNRNVNISAGTVAFKGNAGNCYTIIGGDYQQTGGVLLLHNNPLATSVDTIQILLKGNFIQSNGVLNFDDHATGSTLTSLILKGNEFKCTGSSLITRALTGNLQNAGQLIFNTTGIIQYRMLAGSVLDNITQTIAERCTINVMEGNFQLSSQNQPTIGMLSILPTATLNLQSAQLVSNLKKAYSGFSVFEDGSLITSNVNGFYNTVGTAAVKHTGNMNFYLDAKSIIEYAGVTAQMLTGLSGGVVRGEQHKYGKLIINVQDSMAEKGVLVNSPSVFIRKKLILKSGPLSLNNQTITIENGNPDALNFEKGFLKSTSEKGCVKWIDMKSGTYILPFAESPTQRVPITYSPVGNVSSATFYTYRTAKDKRPFPENTKEVMVDGKDITENALVNRWYGIDAPGSKATLTLTFLPGEKSDMASDSSIFKIINYSNQWNALPTINTKNNTTLTTTDCSASGVFGIVMNGEFTEGAVSTTDIKLTIKQIFPHPFAESFTMDYIAPNDGNVSFSIVNTKGQILYANKKPCIAGLNRFTFREGNTLSPGIYFISVSGFSTTITQKIMHL
jgi:hypothetical protein